MKKKILLAAAAALAVMLTACGEDAASARETETAPAGGRGKCGNGRNGERGSR